MNRKTKMKTKEDYISYALELGMATEADFPLNPEVVRELTDAFRVQHGFSKAKTFEVYPSPMAVIRAYRHLPAEDRPTANNAYYGQHDASWLIPALYEREVNGDTEKIKGVKHLIELCKHVGWFWLDETRTLVSKKPVRLSLRDKASGIKVLHHAHEPAMLFEDGSGVYAVDGVRVPKEFLPAFKSRDPQQFLKVSNAEVRAALLSTLGADLVDVLRTTTLDEETLETPTPEGYVPLKYRLLSFELEDSTRTYLEMTCPSKGSRHVEAVPPTCRTVANALSWREDGVIQDTYTLPKIRS
jgi:hypothetical protein